MAVTSERSNLEVILESLAGQVKQLETKKKVLEVRIKELQGEVECAEVDADAKIAKERAAVDAAIAALKEEIAPYKDLAQQVARQKAEIAAAKQKLQGETANLIAERHATLKLLDERIRLSQKRVSALAQEEASFRQRVAAIA